MGLGAHPFSAYSFQARETELNNFEDIQTFENQIPSEELTPDPSVHHHIYPGINPSHDGHITGYHLEGQPFKSQRKPPAKSLFWPIVLVIVPITLLAAALLALVYVYEVRTDPDIFGTLGDDVPRRSQSILVNFPATRLVFVASFLSSVAPILASFVMALWSLPIIDKMRLASMSAHDSQLPTPYQLSLVIGITLTSYERLWKYFLCLFSRSRTSIPPVLHRAALMLTFTTVLAIAVIVSDSVLHYTTETVQFDQITQLAEPDLALGRGLSDYCLTLDRIENSGVPCSYNVIGTDPNTDEELNESFRLAHNTSQTSEIVRLEENLMKRGDLVILTPNNQQVPSYIDYQATTIGVSTQCHPITTQCDMRSEVDNDFHTLFNCSETFWGVLGEAPPSNQNFTKAVSPNIPGLAYKPSSTLQYEFFTGPDLKTPYNSVGYNSSGDLEFPPLTDAELINPIYMAFAGRISFDSESVGSNINNDSEVFIAPDGNTAFFDFALSCTLTSYDVTYVSMGDSINVTDFTPSLNGSILEIFHGYQFYVTLTDGGAYDLQDFLFQSALQNTSDALAAEWGSLYSTKVLSRIGGYITPRTNLAQQQRKQILVAKVPVGPLAALIACSLAYTLLGLVLGCVAYRASTTEVRDLAAELSLAGLVTAALGEKSAFPSPPGTGISKGGVISHKITRLDTPPEGVDGNSENVYEYKGWV